MGFLFGEALLQRNCCIHEYNSFVLNVGGVVYLFSMILPLGGAWCPNLAPGEVKNVHHSHAQKYDARGE
jgi:hypothetical protein